MKTRTLSRKALLSLIVVALIVWYRVALIDILRVIGNQEAVSAYLRGYGSLGPLVLFVLMVAQVFIAVIPGHALMVTAGYVYGLTGLGTVILSTVFGSQAAFLIARRYGRGLIYRIASPEIIQRWDSTARYQGTLFYFFTFVLPIFPGDLMCYVAGLSTISARRFFIANLLGRTCCAVFVTLIGMYGMHPPVEFWLLAILGVSTLFAGWWIYRKLGCLSGMEASHD